MSLFKPLAQACFLALGVMLFAPGCVVPVHEEPHEGYYDRDHHRWYHEHGWHDCEEHDLHCHY